MADFPEAWELLSLDDLESSSDEDTVGSVEDEEEDDDDDVDEGDDPHPQLFARKKSYHDSHRLNGRKFVQNVPLKQPITAYKSELDDSERPVVDGRCHIYEQERYPSAALVQSLGPDSTDGKCGISYIEIARNTGHLPAPRGHAEQCRFTLRADGYIFANNESALEHLRLEARRLFHHEKETVLMKLPEAHRKSFGVMGFYKDHTVLVVSPYSVPPGNLRTMWLSKLAEVSDYERCRRINCG